MIVGSLFSGIGGIELGLGLPVAWHSEIDPDASTILQRHWDVPNLGDITKIDWHEVESVDVLCGGFPCQDISFAGKGAGIAEGTRSGLWSEYARAIGILRPRYVFIENVSALAIRGLDRVLADLASFGFDAEWTSLRASAIGAPHRRERLFIVAANTSGERRQSRTGLRSSDMRGNWRGHVDNDGGEAVTDTDSGTIRQQPELVTERSSAAESGRSGQVSSDANINGREVVERKQPRLGPRGDTDGRSPVDWGSYEPAVRRWEQLTRPAPAPTEGRRLAPAFVEWMMGFPEGWVDGLTRTAALRCLGNAVVPACAATAWQLLTDEAVAA